MSLFKRLFSRSSQDAYNSGMDAYNQGDFPVAIARFESVLESASQGSPVYLLSRFFVTQSRVHLGCAYIEAGRHDEARDALVQVLKSHPEYPDVHYRLGQVAEHKGMDREAIMRYRQALTLNERYREPRLALALCLRRNGRVDEAARHFADLASTGLSLPQSWIDGTAGDESPDLITRIRQEVAEVRNSRAFVAEGVRAYHDGNLTSAYVSFSKAVEKAPNHPDLRCRKATVLGELGRLKEAIDELTFALELNPSYEEARLKRGVAELQLGAFDEAAEDFLHVLKSGPDNDELELLCGIALLRARKPEDALPHLTTATMSDNTAVRAVYFLAQAYVEMERPDRAVSVLEAHPSPANLVMLGRLQIDLGEYEAAGVALQSALNQGQKTPAVHLALAKAKFFGGDNSVALAYAKFAMSDPKTAPDAAYLMARIAFEAGNDAQALHWLSKHPHPEPSYDSLVLRGRAFSRVGRQEEAKATLEKAAQLRPDADEAQRALGLLIQQMDSRRGNGPDRLRGAA